MISVNEGRTGGVGAQDVRRDSAAGIKGDGKEVRLEAGVVVGGLIEDMEDGRDGNN